MIALLWPPCVADADSGHYIYSAFFADYWKYLVARFNDVHAFGYNSAGSERIWMKFSEFRVYIVWVWAAITRQS